MMGFVLGQLGQLGMVAIVMACATGGTMGILKLIKHFSPGKEIPKDPIAKKLEDAGMQDKSGER